MHGVRHKDYLCAFFQQQVEDPFTLLLILNTREVAIKEANLVAISLRLSLSWMAPADVQELVLLAKLLSHSTSVHTWR